MNEADTAASFRARVLAECAAHIREHGWSCTMVGGGSDSPPFAYTTGLWVTYRHAELITVLPHPMSHGVLVGAVRLIQGGDVLTDGCVREDILEEFPVRFRGGSFTLPMAVTNAYYGDGRSEVPFLQLLWPDEQGRFPDDHGCDEASVAWQTYPTDLRRTT